MYKRQTVSGFESIGDKVYTALCPLGFSDYGIESGAAEGYEDLIAEDEETGEKSISATVHPNQVWIGIYDGINNFDKKPTIITDNRISYATSRYRSQLDVYKRQHQTGFVTIYFRTLRATS